MCIDIQRLSAQISTQQVVEMLGLQLTQIGRQWRGPCPVCKLLGDRGLVITEGRGWYCFLHKKGGDQIALAAHILRLEKKEAAARLADYFGIDGITTGTKESQSERGTVTEFPPFSYLEYENKAVQTLGIDVRVAQELGLGYAKKGILRDRVVIPLRKKDGRLVGYCGYSAETAPHLKFMKNLLRD